MQPPVGVDTHQIRWGIECRVTNFRERDAVRNHRLTKLLVWVGNDMSRIKQDQLGLVTTKRAA
jgi:hypothetical protein